MSIDISKMTDEEKEAHVDTVEIMQDFGDGDKLSDEDFAIYDAIIAERENNTRYEGWRFEGGIVKLSPVINRLQIFFDESPDADVRTELKSNGFRLAPSTGAYQRDLTDNALDTAKHMKIIAPIANDNSQKDSGKSKLDNVIASAQKRRATQNEINTEQIDHEAR